MELTKEPIYWGIDIGGTSAKIGYLSNNSFFLTDKIPTGINSNPDSLLKEIASVIKKTNKRPSSIGVGIAGMVSRSTNTVISSPNLPLWKKVPLQAILTKQLRVPVAIDNDCNVFAIGSIHSKIIPIDGLWLFITLGTGIGGTIINNGQIIYGTDFAGEFGHSTVNANGDLCKCGSHGCWELYAGSKALVEYYSNLSGESILPINISSEAEKNNTYAVQAYQEYGKWVGIGLANLANIFSPNGFFLGGGISSAFHHFKEATISEYKKRSNLPLRIKVVADTSTAGAYGAAVLGMKQC